MAQHKLVGQISNIFKGNADLLEYRWSRMYPAQREWIFDTVLVHFILTKQIYVACNANIVI